MTTTPTETEAVEPTVTEPDDGLTHDRIRQLVKMLEHHPDTDSWSYTGPLDEGKALADRDRYTAESKSVDGRHHIVVLGDYPDPTLENCAEFGIHPDLEQAWRYALGALCGPPEAEGEEPPTPARRLVVTDNPALPLAYVEDPD
jgi:hypothetical protein